MNLAFDFGYGNIKVKTDEGDKIIFPTICKSYRSKLDQRTSKFKYVVDVNDKTYAVGDFASSIGDTARNWSKEHQLMQEEVNVYLGTALYELTKSSPETCIDVNISVGLPVDHFDTQKNELKKILKGMSIKVNDKQFNINNARISQQGVGAYLALLMDLKGNMKNDIDKRLFIQGGGIIDIGYRTIDGVKITVTEDGIFALSDPDSGSFDGTGMIRAYQQCADDINSMYGVDYTPLDIENALKNPHADGFIFISGEKIDVKPIFNNALKQLASKISNLISAKWNNPNKFGVIYLCGGGAELIKPYLEIKGVEIELQDDAVFANCNGYLANLNDYLANLKSTEDITREDSSDKTEEINQNKTAIL